MPKIFVTDRAGKQLTLEARSGETLMEPLREIDDGIEALCGGMCSCSTCHIYIDKDWTGKVDAAHSDELELLESTENYHQGESRLACQVKVTDAIDGMRLTVAPEG